MSNYLRDRIDNAIRQVWLEFRDASDYHMEMLTQQDLDLWSEITKHKAIQSRFTIKEDNNG
jgi:hypothetical protein